MILLKQVRWRSLSAQRTCAAALYNSNTRERSPFKEGAGIPLLPFFTFSLRLKTAIQQDFAVRLRQTTRAGVPPGALNIHIYIHGIS